MLNFTEAVQEVSKEETAAPVLTERLKAEIAKLSLGDVHVPTALGNEDEDGKPKKRPSFKELILSATSGRPERVMDADDTPDGTGGAIKRIGGPTMLKDEVGYKADWPDEASQCQKCSMFKPDCDECTLVIGPIRPTAHCDKFEAIKQAREGNDEWRRSDFVLKAAEPDRQLVFGWASVAARNGKLIVDKQGDIITPEELERAAYDFVLYSRTQGDMHDRKGVGRVVAAWVTMPELNKAFGLTVENDIIGWMIGFKVDDPAVWRAIKSGERPEFSIGGRGKREEL